MFAIICSGGKQYRVSADDVIIIEKLDAVEAGQSVTFEDVLMVSENGSVKVGEPKLSGISVSGEVLEQRRGDKVIVFKKKRRKNYRRTQGHRQYETIVRIKSIGGKKAKSKSAASKSKAETSEPAVEKKSKTSNTASTDKSKAPKKPAQASAKKPAKDVKDKAVSKAGAPAKAKGDRDSGKKE